MDETSYVDPGLNLAAGKGWTSSMWPWQTDREFFAQQSPLYPATLSLWARVFGVSMVATRAHCYCLGALGTFFFWLAAFRFKFLSSPARLFWIVLLSTEASTNWMMRNARYDIWIFVGLSLALLGTSFKHPASRYGVIFLGCFLGPAAGFVCLPYIFGMVAALTIITRFSHWKEAVAALVGAGSGMAAVFAFYAMNGFLGVFVNTLRKLSLVTAKTTLLAKLKIFLYPTQDVGVVLMIAALLLLTLANLKNKTVICRRWMMVGWAAVFLVPALMLARASFNTMYFYMVIIPLSLSILALFSLPVTASGHRLVTATVAGLLGICCFTGLPARIFIDLQEWRLRDPRLHENFVNHYMRSNDCVLADWQFYYVLRDRVRFSMNEFYLQGILPDQAAQINVVCLPAKLYPDLDRDASRLGNIGGGWKKIAVFPSEDMQTQLAGLYPPAPVCVLYRRQTATSP